ncbi:MAG: cytochrome P450 [Parvibaculales bacterium]
MKDKNNNQIDLFSEEVSACPFSSYKEIRDSGRVYQEPRYGNHVLTHFADILSLKNDQIFDARHGVDPAGRFSSTTYPDINRTDPPRHAKIKAFLYKSFAPPAIKAWEADIHKIFMEHFDAVQGGSFDIVHHICYPAPAAVICRLLGFSDDRRDDFQRWSAALVERLGTEISEEQRNALIEMARFIRLKAEEKAQNPGKDLMTEIVFAEVEGEKLSHEEVVANGVFFLAAGHETTANFLSNFTVQLATIPGLFDRLKSDRTLLKPALEECLRLESPVQNICRTVKEDMSIDNQAIHKDERVMFSLGAGNRDPEIFANPDDYDLERENLNQHLAFGYGHHQCLGARLARLEGEIFSNIVLDRFDKIELGEGFTRQPGNVMRGYKSLNVKCS